MTITILVIITTGILLPIEAYGQLPYLPTAPPAEENESSNSGYALSNTAGAMKNPNFGNKVVIINFDDGHPNQYTYGRPILDKYGFKATFFEVCGWIGVQDWQNIYALQKDGMDIEVYSMTHPDLNKVSQAQLKYEIDQSKECFLKRGIDTAIFTYPYGYGSNNATVVNTTSRDFDLARGNSYYDFANANSDDFPLAFLQCDAISNQNNHPSQSDCRTYSDDGKLTFANRYSLNSWSHIHIDGNYSNTGACTGICHNYNNSQMLGRFITAVNSLYRVFGIIRAIPIIVYHGLQTYPDISYSTIPTETTVNLFDSEMKYLHENGFKVVTMSHYYMYIKDMNR